MPVLRMCFLGVPELAIDDVPIHLERRNSLALLAYLVLTNRLHSREELATLFAGDIGDDAARKRLRNALADLVEHGLGPYLQTSRQTIAFDQTSEHSLDLLRLDGLGRNGAAIDPDDLSWAAERCDWELLAGLGLRDAPGFETWLFTEREYRGQQLREIAERYLQRLLATEQYEAGIRLAQRLLVLVPWDEAVHRVLMLMLARGGQVAAALAQYNTCVDILAEELGIEPQPETTELHERLQSGPVAPRHNLPATIMPEEILGRDDVLRSIADNLVEPACRMLTIVGLGGSGKTSLALAAGVRLTEPAPLGDRHPFADGIMLVNVAEIQDSATRVGAKDTDDRRIATSIGFALGMAFYGHIDRLSQVIAYLQPKRMLLILDNIDHLGSGSAALLAILRGAPGVTLLVTSRQALGVPDEWVQELGGLPVPESVDDLEHAPASQLFLRDARRASVPLEPEDLPAVVEICRLTGGWPLAIKIAAGWLVALTCAEIVRELRGGGALLNEPMVAPGAGPMSIRSIVSASYDALPERDRRALRRLAVFTGPFSLTAAAAVGVKSPSLVALSQRSLVERCDRENYRLYPLVSQYALEQLSTIVADEVAARAEHAGYFASFVAERSPSLFTSPSAHGDIARERANLYAAWDWAVAQRDIRLLTQLLEGMAVWNQQAGLHREWTMALTSAIAQTPSDASDPIATSMLARLLVAKAESLLWQGDLDSAFLLLADARRCAERNQTLDLEALISYCEGRLLRFRGGEGEAASEHLMQARVLARATHQPRVEASSLLPLSYAATDDEQYAAAESYLGRAEAAFQAMNDRLALARTTNHHGRLLLLRGDFIRAQVILDQSVHMARAFGDRFLEGYSELHLGIVNDIAFGRHQEADEHFERAASIASHTGDPYFDGNLHRAIGRNALHAGDFDRADASFRRAIDRARDVGNTRAISDSLRCLAQLATRQSAYDLAEDHAQQSLQMSMEQGRRNASAATLLCLGLVHERLGRLSNAAAAYTEAFGLAEALQISYLSCDASAGLARVSLAAGDVGLAIRYVERILPYLQHHALAGCDELTLVVDACHRVLDAAGDDRAIEVVRAGSELLSRRINALPLSRRGWYLDALPERRAMHQRWLEGTAAMNADERMNAQLLGSFDQGALLVMSPNVPAADQEQAVDTASPGQLPLHRTLRPRPARRRRRRSSDAFRRRH